MCPGVSRRMMVAESILRGSCSQERRWVVGCELVNKHGGGRDRNALARVGSRSAAGDRDSSVSAACGRRRRSMQ
jgi:hypothetical protein